MLSTPEPITFPCAVPTSTTAPIFDAGVTKVYRSAINRCKALLRILNTWESGQDDQISPLAHHIHEDIQHIITKLGNDGHDSKDDDIQHNLAVAGGYLKGRIAGLCTGSECGVKAAGAVGKVLQLLAELRPRVNREEGKLVHQIIFHRPSIWVTVQSLVANRRTSDTALVIKLDVLLSEVHALRRVASRDPSQPDNRFNPYLSTIYPVLREQQQQQNQGSPPITPVVQQDLLAMQSELAVLRQTCCSLRESATQGLAQASAQLTQFRQHQEHLMSTAKPSGRRAALLAEKESIEHENTLLQDRLTHLTHIVDTLRMDVTRKADPAKLFARWEAAHTECQSLMAGMTAFVKNLDSVRPRWKNTWEQELQGIVREQAYLKKKEGCSVELEEEQERVMEILQKVGLVIEMAVTTSDPTAPKPALELDVLSADELQTVGLAPILSQIQLASSGSQEDSDRRLKALKVSESVRQWERSIDARAAKTFEQELVGVVHGDTLKKTGGVAHVDRLRARKDAAHRKTATIRTTTT
ncbi:actin interacting protein 3-domain-containing protein [Phlyctochytrium arcticum]|nr:actin interacting protein 3-domain-containing protein [Phlyctochytrium arcticum]